jgi:glutathionylspermidine synthase
MERLISQPRPDWPARLEQHGFLFHSDGKSGTYWDESVCYRFGAAEIDRLEEATAELHALCLDAVDRIVRGGRYEAFALTPAAMDFIERSWKQRAPHLYGRMDLAYDGGGAPRLLEYNADTPTTLLEAAVAQWVWMEQVHPGADQFNSIHEKLIARWRVAAAGRVHFAAVTASLEDRGTLLYLADTASQAGIEPVEIDIGQIGWNERRGFVDLDERPIETLFKLYPTEWMLREAFGRKMTTAPTRWIEPAWKLLLSSKAVLPLLWEFNPGHPNLLEAHYGEPPAQGRWARKPIYSREGANVSLVDCGQAFAAVPGRYGDQPVIHQAYTPLFQRDGRHAVIGSWIVGDEAAGIGIREDVSAVTLNSSRFVPHYFE